MNCFTLNGAQVIWKPTDIQYTDEPYIKEILQYTDPLSVCKAPSSRRCNMCMMCALSPYLYLGHDFMQTDVKRYWASLFDSDRKLQVACLV